MQGTGLSEAELQRWVGTFAEGPRRHSIERDGDTLFYRIDKLPRAATIPLSAEKLRLESEATHLTLRKGWFGREYLGIQDHPERRVREFRRVQG